MNPSNHPDDEELAAFLDGRLGSESREDMIAHLVRNDEDREVAAGTAQILRQTEELDQECPTEMEE